MTQHLHAGIGEVKRRLAEEAALIIQRLNVVIEAVLTADAGSLRHLIRGDPAIVRMETDIEQQCLDLLLLRGPLASDFRFVLTCIKVNSELAGVDDVIVRIARRAETLARPAIQCPFDLKEMANIVVKMLQTAVESVVRCDESLVNTILIQQNAENACQRRATQTIESLAPRVPSVIPQLLQMLALAHCLEQIASTALRIADEATYLVQGRVVRYADVSP